MMIKRFLILIFISTIGIILQAQEEVDLLRKTVTNNNDSLSNSGETDRLDFDIKPNFIWLNPNLYLLSRCPSKTGCPDNTSGEGHGRGDCRNILCTIWNAIKSIFIRYNNEDDGDGGGSGGGGGGGGGETTTTTTTTTTTSSPTNGSGQGNGGINTGSNGTISGGGGGSGGITPPINPTILLLTDATTMGVDTSKNDTLQPIRVPCPNKADSIGSYLSQIMKLYIDTSVYMQNLTDSAQIKSNEAGFTIDRHGIGTTNSPYTYGTNNYNGNGATNYTNITTGLYTIATVHLHPYNGGINIPSPSPGDIKMLLTAWNDHGYFSPFMANMTVSGNANTDQYMIAVTDNTAIKNYSDSNPISNLSDTALLDVDGNPNSNMNGWSGDPTDDNSYRHKFDKAVKQFIKEGYNSNDAYIYANVYMLSNNYKIGGLNMGITMYKRDLSGNYKALNFETFNDTKGKVHFRITICQ